MPDSSRELFTESIKGRALTGDLHSTAIMSQRLFENHIQRRLNFLNQQIDLRREAELRERNLQRLCFMQRGRGRREPRKVISDYYKIGLTVLGIPGNLKPARMCTM
jgi:hypothetical protein